MAKAEKGERSTKGTEKKLKNNFKEDDKVFAMDGGELYVAKVMKLRESGNQYTYFLHYMGWNSRWDKWVAESDLMAAGPEAQEMQKHLKEKQQQEKAAKAKRKEKEVLSKEEQKAKKARVDVKRDTEDDTGVPEVKVAMPFTLKKQLIADWENITQEPRRLVKLPRELTAARVMANYMENKAKRSTPQQTARAQELMDGVRIHFDKAHKRVVMKGKKPKDSEQKLETTGREEARFNHERCVGAETPSLSERKEKPLSSARPAAELRGAGENLRHRHRPTRESKRRTENTARVAENVDELAKQASLEKEQRRAEIYAINSLMRAAFERELAAYTLAKKEQAQGTIGTDESVPGLYVAEVE